MFKKAAGIAAIAIALAGCDHQEGPGPMNDYTIGGAYAPGSYEDFKASVSDRVFFALNSAAVHHEAKPVLAAQAEWLNKNPEADITLEGHCDERGTHDYNLALGDRRAHSVKKALMSMGVSESRISAVSYGKSRPADLGHNEAAWAKNRRVVTVIHDQK